ncbi:hypothetical protein EUTSA_v10029110mg [Eutrema salsugineum]|uniref:Uncharacterized protein n=1 Tax=Eutrema salsugineum TaxID=72664 RepID=V4L8E1_EUTSA|nr:hypothetical protein EUTSA_v10029110mg [Eutrema salsugineum]
MIYSKINMYHTIVNQVRTSKHLISKSKAKNPSQENVDSFSNHLRCLARYITLLFQPNEYWENHIHTKEWQ